MALDPQHITAIYDALQDKARALKLFRSINGAEPLNPPTSGLSYSLMFGKLGPARRASGLASTSGRLEFTARVEAPRTSQTQEQTDKALLYAVVSLMVAYSGDFELADVPDGLVQSIDLLGAYGTPMEAIGGWITQGEVPYRMADMTLAVILNDVFPQAV